MDDVQEPESHPLTVWSGMFFRPHRKRLGPAMSVYGWCLARIFKPEIDGFGFVNAGRAVKIARIAEEEEFDERTVRGHLERLQSPPDGRPYIHVLRGQHGVHIVVLRSKRWKAGSARHILTASDEEFEREVGGHFPRWPDRKILSDLRSEDSFRSQPSRSETSPGQIGKDHPIAYKESSGYSQATT
ncbi:MAG: hypothetical protein VW405_02545, partial [Rhodospirillaceae bacterium]